jgi:hypothetical protein
LCLAVLCLAVLTPAAALVLFAFLPLCFMFLVTASFAGVIDMEREPLRPAFFRRVPARAPPVVS